MRMCPRLSFQVILTWSQALLGGHVNSQVFSCFFSVLSFSLSCFCCFFACSSKMSNKRTILTRHAHWALQEQLQQQRRRGVLRLRRHTRYQCWYEHNGLVEQVACPILNLHFPLEEQRFPPFNGDGHGGRQIQSRRTFSFLSLWQNDVTGKLETRFWNSNSKQGGRE